MAIPVFLFTVEGFIRRPADTRITAPFQRSYQGFVSAAEALERFEALEASARDTHRPESPVQRVILRRHRLDVDTPLAVLAAALVTEDLTKRDDPSWAVATTITHRYYERPRKEHR